MPSNSIRSLSIKDRVDRLFRAGRPSVRPYDPRLDRWVLWAAYDLGSFEGVPKGLTPSEFAERSERLMGLHSAALVITDACRYFRDGSGPVGLVTVDNFGWRIEPRVDWFYWATPKAKVRGTVAFLRKCRSDAGVGVVLVRSEERWRPFLRKLGKLYGVLWECGVIKDGRPEGDEFLFSRRGGRKQPQAKMMEAA